MNFLELQTAVVVMTPIESTFSLDVNSNLGNIKVMINLFLVKPCFPVDLLIMMMRISSEKVSLFKYLSCVELGQYQVGFIMFIILHLCTNFCFERRRVSIINKINPKFKVHENYTKHTNEEIKDQDVYSNTTRLTHF